MGRRMDPQRIEQIRRCAAERMTVAEAAGTVGISAQAVRNIARRHGIVLAPIDSPIKLPTNREIKDRCRALAEELGLYSPVVVYHEAVDRQTEVPMRRKQGMDLSRTWHDTAPGRCKAEREATP